MKQQELSQNNALTFESVWAGLQETRRMLDAQIIEHEILRKEEAERRRVERKKWEEQRDEDRYQMKELKKELRGIGFSNGDFAEEYFFSSFRKGRRNFFGEQFDIIEKKVKPLTKFGLQDQYDIVFTNGTSVAIIEVKYNAAEKAIKQILRKVETFRILVPEYKDYKIYLGIASLVFDEMMEKLCKENGIAIIKQVGENVVIIDDGLKVF